VHYHSTSTRTKRTSKNVFKQHLKLWVHAVKKKSFQTAVES